MTSASDRLLLLDIGNTHCHAAVATTDRLLAHSDVPTSALLRDRSWRVFRRLLGSASPEGVVLCSVVPQATRRMVPLLQKKLGLKPLVLTSRTVRGVGLDYPDPDTIGPDRLANAIAARHEFGAPCVVVDFGTAVTFDILDRRGRYVGGIIAPGLAAMTEYLHEKTALLPRIQIRDVESPIGKSTEEAMLIGAVHGYRGLVRELIRELRHTLGVRKLRVIATGGYAQFMAQGLREITSVRPHLTLEGLRLLWGEHNLRPSASRRPSLSRRA